jgi:phosphonate transport system substrate-binding protein
MTYAGKLLGWSFLLLLSATGVAWGDAASVFRLGVINERPEKPDHALSQYGKLHEYLKTKLAERGVQVGRLVITRSIEEMADRISDGEVDGLIDGVMPTLDIQQRTEKLEPALLTWRKGQRQYHSVFFVRKDSPIKGLRDLSGHTIAFESPRSTSAFYIPQAALRAEGLSLIMAQQPEAESDTVRYEFAGSELNQVYWVHRGRADAGAFNNGDWERVPARLKQDLHIIHATRPILRWLFSFASDLDQHTRNNVIDILTSAHHEPNGREALQTAAQIAKFEILTDEDWAGLQFWSSVLTGKQ